MVARFDLVGKENSMSGRSLLEAILGITIVTAAASVYMANTGTSLKKNKAVNLKTDLVDFREMIRQKIDCDATLAGYLPRPIKPTACSGQVAILGRDGSELVSKGGSSLREWRIEAECENIPGDGLGLSFFATRPNPSGGYKEDTGTPDKSDPSKNQKFDRSHPSARIFPSWARVCSEFFRTGAPDNECGANEVATGAINSDGSVICSSVPKICENMGGRWATNHCEFPLPEVNCAPGQTLVGIKPDGTATCVAAAERVKLYRVQSITNKAQAAACCNKGDKIVACTGSREQNVEDTCEEEECGYIGSVLKGNCCVAGADQDSGTETVADAVCVPSN